jgi:glycosyltransferase involved in cell wall biosynthesis
MRIAFYAPLKAPGHPVPSGDRQMARLLIAALERAGHRVQVVSELRAYLPDAEDAAGLRALREAAALEALRIGREWQAEGAPDLWFCYHPYYKSPDLIGPALCGRFGLPWICAEASLSARRSQGIWAETQAEVAAALRDAALTIGMTARDRDGIAQLCPGARIAPLRPFIDTAALPAPGPAADGPLVTVAMMRPGDKMESYRALAAALGQVRADWRLEVAGDGPMAAEVHALFPQGKVRWHGQLPPQGIAALLHRGSIHAWPGCGEAYGLAYLEAQAAGLPVVAWATAGVPEVVRHGETGLLSEPGDTGALAADIDRLLADPALRRQMGAQARRRVLADHGLESAAAELGRLLHGVKEPRP